MLGLIEFLDDLTVELETALDLYTPQPFLKMATHLIRNHLEGKTVTPSSLAAASGAGAMDVPVPFSPALEDLTVPTPEGVAERARKAVRGELLHAA